MECHNGFLCLGPNKHQSAVTCLQFNSRFVITSSDDGTVKLWDVKTGKFLFFFQLIFFPYLLESQ